MTLKLHFIPFLILGSILFAPVSATTLTQKEEECKENERNTYNIVLTVQKMKEEFHTELKKELKDHKEQIAVLCNDNKKLVHKVLFEKNEKEQAQNKLERLRIAGLVTTAVGLAVTCYSFTQQRIIGETYDSFDKGFVRIHNTTKERTGKGNNCLGIGGTLITGGLGLSGYTWNSKKEYKKDRSNESNTNDSLPPEKEEECKENEKNMSIR